MDQPTAFPRLPTELAIARCARQISVARVLRVALLSATFLVPLASPVLATRQSGLVGGLLLWGLPLAVMLLWILASVAGVRVSRLVQAAPSLIAAGLLEQAELRLAEGIRRFTLARSSKLLALHHLALLRHAQRCFADSARLAEAALARGVDSVDPQTGVSARLLVADASLELDDLSRCHAMLLGLRSRGLPLSDLLHLTALEVDYLGRIAAWREMLQDLRRRLELSELMPPAASVRAQAWLALAAAKCGDSETSEYLSRRCRLLADPGELVSDRAAFAELFGDGAGSDPAAQSSSSAASTAIPTDEPGR